MICKQINILKIKFLNEFKLFMHTVKCFQVLLYNSPNVISVICLHTVCSVRPTDRTLFGALSQGQSGPESKGNEGVLLFPQISKTRALPSDD